MFPTLVQKPVSFSVFLDAFDLCGSLPFYLCKPQACTICLSHNSGLSTPYQLEHRIMVQKKALCLRLIKGGWQFFPSNTRSLSETLVSRGGGIVGTLWRARLALEPSWLFRREGMHSAGLRDPGLFIKHHGHRPRSSDRWSGHHCVTETMSTLRLGGQVALVRNRPTQIALKMT